MRLVSLKGSANYTGAFSFKTSDNGFTVLARKSLEKREHVRLGVVIAKRVCPRAVDRTRIRRLIKEMVVKRVDLSRSLDIVVKVRLLFPKLKHKEARLKLNKLLRVIEV